jgi:hypothetical protein
MNDDRTTRAMLELARFSFESAVNNMERCEAQAVRCVGSAFRESPSISHATRRATENWLLRVRNVGRMYSNVVEAGLLMLAREMGSDPPADKECVEIHPEKSKRREVFPMAGDELSRQVAAAVE